MAYKNKHLKRILDIYEKEIDPEDISMFIHSTSSAGSSSSPGDDDKKLDPLENRIT